MADWHVARLVHIGAGGEDGDIYIRTLLGLRVVLRVPELPGLELLAEEPEVSQCRGPGRDK